MRFRLGLWLLSLRVAEGLGLCDFLGRNSGLGLPCSSQGFWGVPSHHIVVSGRVGAVLEPPQLSCSKGLLAEVGVHLDGDLMDSGAHRYQHGPSPDSRISGFSPELGEFRAFIPGAYAAPGDQVDSGQLVPDLGLGQGRPPP